MVNRGNIKSRCKGWLQCNSRGNGGVQALGTDSGSTGRVQKPELNTGSTGCTGSSEGISDACVLFADQSSGPMPKTSHVILMKRI